MTHPIILSISGHDPSGGAGIQADIEAISACGGRAVTVPTCATVQDTENVYSLVCTSPELLHQQIERLFADLPIAAIKIGLMGSAEIAEEISLLLQRYPTLPVVVDPVLASGTGTKLANETMIDTIQNKILPFATLATPNSLEARKIAGEDSLEECAKALLGMGCAAVLITGTHESDNQVINRLYQPQQPTISSRWQRLPERYHGSGCTLASAAATCLVRHPPLESAVAAALEYTWTSLSKANRPGKGQWIPNRLFRLDPSNDPTESKQ